MRLCPNCSNPIGADAPKCDKCGAVFVSSWKPLVAEPEKHYPVEFTASAGEYFRIWIVNLVLTILTVGIYSAWAKVRKKRYFYGHTRIDRDSFEYRGRPIAILKGRLIAVAERDLPEITARRRAHYLQLLSLCEGSREIKPMYPNLPQGVCPYVFPVLVKNDVQRWVDFLRTKGVPASRWPDLPPEVRDSQVFPETANLAEHTVLLPIHQSLTTAQVDKMGSVLTNCSGGL